MSLFEGIKCDKCGEVVELGQDAHRKRHQHTFVFDSCRRGVEIEDYPFGGEFCDSCVSRAVQRSHNIGAEMIKCMGLEEAHKRWLREMKIGK